MAKRYTDTTIWKNQRWFKKLSPIHKLAWKYITDTCDHAGILKIDFSEFTDDLGVDEFNILDFIHACNVDFDKKTGTKIKRERIKLINENVVWITGFIKFQYENKDLMVNPAVPAIYSALTILNGYGTLNEGLEKGYLTLSQPYIKGMLRTKDKDKDKDIYKDNKGGMGEKEGGKSVAPKMVSIFKKYNPGYPEESEADFTACLNIALKIGKSKGWEQNDVVGSKQKDVVELWEKIVKFTSADKWYSTRSISALNKEWQSLIQSMNGKFSGKHKNNSNDKGFIEVPDNIDYDNMKF